MIASDIVFIGIERILACFRSAIESAVERYPVQVVHIFQFIDVPDGSDAESRCKSERFETKCANELPFVVARLSSVP